MGVKSGSFFAGRPHASVSAVRRLCLRLIDGVENVLVGRADDDWEWHADYQQDASYLESMLSVSRIPIDDRLTYFRDYVVGSSDPSVKSFGVLGLPCRSDSESPDTAPRVDLRLGRAWLQHMRHFCETLASQRHGGRGECRSGGLRSGRKKSHRVREMEQMVEEVFAEERKHLSRNGVGSQDVPEWLRRLTAVDVLRRINDRQPHRRPVPLHGTSCRKYQRQVTRSPAWRALHGCKVSQNGSKDPDAPAWEKPSEATAAAHGLTIRFRASYLQRQNHV